MTERTPDLTSFLLARIGEDERAASREIERRNAEVVATASASGQAFLVVGYALDPARVLAECAAKRRIIDVWVAQWSTPEDGYPSRPLGGQGGEVYYDVLWHLASVYADHPEYREEWKP